MGQYLVEDEALLKKIREQEEVTEMHRRRLEDIKEERRRKRDAQKAKVREHRFYMDRAKMCATKAIEMETLLAELDGFARRLYVQTKAVESLSNGQVGPPYARLALANSAIRELNDLTDEAQSLLGDEDMELPRLKGSMDYLFEHYDKFAKHQDEREDEVEAWLQEDCKEVTEEKGMGKGSQRKRGRLQKDSIRRPRGRGGYMRTGRKWTDIVEENEETDEDLDEPRRGDRGGGDHYAKVQIDARTFRDKQLYVSEEQRQIYVRRTEDMIQKQEDIRKRAEARGEQEPPMYGGYFHSPLRGTGFNVIRRVEDWGFREARGGRGV